MLLQITSSAMCGTDLHIYEGRMGEPTGMVIGHEPLGASKTSAKRSSTSKLAIASLSRPISAVGFARAARLGATLSA